MKPNWSDSPSWANYLAQDANGAWWWYANKPIIWNENDVEWRPNGSSAPAKISMQWRGSLEERPVRKSSFDYEAEGK
jgi:hypothetical protein